MPAHAYLEQQLVFHKRKPWWNSVRSTIFPQSIFSMLYPLYVVLSVFKANFVPPLILKIRALVLIFLQAQVSAGKLLLAQCVAQIALGLIPRHQLASCTYPFHNRCPEKHCFGTWGRRGEKKLNYSGRCGCFNTHSKFKLVYFVGFFNNELCLLAVSTAVQALAPNIHNSSTQCINLQLCYHSTHFCNSWVGFCMSMFKQLGTPEQAKCIYH